MLPTYTPRMSEVPTGGNANSQKATVTASAAKFHHQLACHHTTSERRTERARVV